MRQKLFRWLDRNATGELIFDHKPYVAYHVHPVKPVEIRQYMRRSEYGKTYSGTFTITLRCYEPFGRMLYSSFTGTPDPKALTATGILPTALMPPLPALTDRQFLLYNPGTERAHTRIRLAGDVGEDGLIIENVTTKQKCKIAGLKADEVPPGAYLEIQSETGQVWLVKGEERELASHYHDLGYIMLASCAPFIRTLRISHTEGAKEITSEDGFAPHMAGQYVYLNGRWMKIHRVQDAHTAHLIQAPTVTGFTSAPVVTMNEMVLRGDGVYLERFDAAVIARAS